MHRFLCLRSPLPWLFLAFAACNLADPKPSKLLTLSVTNTPVSPARPNADVIVGSGPNSLKITKVEFVLGKIELSKAGGCATPPMNEADCDEVKVAPILVNLPLDGLPKVVLDAAVPAGTYARLHAKLAALRSGDVEDGAPASGIDPTFPAGVSVRVTGVYTDATGTAHDFTFTSDARAEIEMAFATPVDVSAATQNLTIAVDVASWFKDASGGAIDPTNSANAETIERNIRASFRSFEDDDRDGVDDHEEVERHTP
jgi:hypothetical protein